MNPRTLILPALTLSVLLAACAKTPRSAGALPHEVYVWQRAWSPAVSAAVDESKQDVARYAVLAAEIAGGEVACPAIDWAALRNSGRPVALVLRLGKNDADGQRAEAVMRLAMQLLGDAQQNGVTASELQIDYDCAESKLGGYRALLQKLRATVPLTVTPTALPSWLKQPEFAALARESGGFVLQVHSTSAPKLGVEKICSPPAARRWVGQAGRLGVPFRVALPTYTYLTAFDAKGKFLGISAEGAPKNFPRDATRQYIRADAREMSALVRGWERDRPLTLSGVIWYRLPVAADRQNWRLPTLLAVMRGEPLRENIGVTVSAPPLCDLVAANSGNLDAPPPLTVSVTWSSGTLSAGDALSGYTLSVSGTAAMFTRSPSAAGQVLPPGEKRAIGWLRFNHAEKVQVKSTN